MSLLGKQISTVSVSDLSEKDIFYNFDGRTQLDTNCIMITETIVIKNEVGLHARPAAQFVKVAEKFASKVRLCKDGIWVNGKSVLGILTLAAEKGSQVILEVDGEDEQDALKELKKILEGVND